MGKKSRKENHSSKSNNRPSISTYNSSRPSVSTYNGKRISTISSKNHFTTEYEPTKKEEKPKFKSEERRKSSNLGKKEVRKQNTQQNKPKYNSKKPYSSNRSYSSNKKVENKNSHLYSRAKEVVGKKISQAEMNFKRSKFFRQISDEYVTPNNNGLLYTCIIKGLEKGKTVTLRKECKMEDIYNLIFVYKNSIEVIKVHFKKDGEIKKFKITYSIPEINIENLTKEGKDELVRKHLKNLCDKLQVLIKDQGYNIFSDKKRITEIKLYDVIEEAHKNEEE